MNLGFLQNLIYPEKRSVADMKLILVRELGQAKVRVALSSFVLAYLVATSYPITLSAGIPAWLSFTSTYVLLSAVLLWHISRSDFSSEKRRFLSNLADMCAISYTMIASGEHGIALFVLFLSVTLGNGFRFGIPSLTVSAVMSVIGFTVAVNTNPHLQGYPSLMAGIYFSLIALPLYTGHLLKLLNSALVRANEASAAKSQFLARMSHEMRTPLNGIMGSADLLRDSQRLVAEDRSLLDVIDDSVNISLRQINNILDFSRLESGKLKLEESPIDLHDLINSAVSMVRPAARAKNDLNLLTRIAPDVPYNLIGDGHHLRAILLNLLSNAVRFTEQGNVWLDVILKNKKGSLVTLGFEVRDTGAGIEQSKLASIFESFTQEDNSTTRKYGGTGLGTTIAKQLVELMGGKIGAESVKGQGSLFWFDIQLSKQPALELKDRLKGSSRAVLLTTNEKQLAILQEKISSHILQAKTGDEAINLIERTARLGNTIHTLFIDDELAIDQKGNHCYNELCKKVNNANVPLVLLTDNTPSHDLLRLWGYAATLRRNPLPEYIHSILHASPHWQEDEGDPRLATIAPVFRKDTKAVRPKILVADDNRTNLMITSRVLEHAGYEVETVDTGNKALDKLYAGSYRLAVLDMHMPGLDGTTVLHQYRMMRPHSPLPAIMLTANASIAAQQASAEAGADSYLTKPVKAQNLLDEVKHLLDQHQVEVIPFKPEVNTIQEIVFEQEDVIDVSVLAELDRIYHDPDELSQLVQDYSCEGKDIIGRIQLSCINHNFSDFCDAVHALKSNAANVGANALMQVCSDVSSIGIVEFSQYRNSYLEELKDAFANSQIALAKIIKSAPEDRGKSIV